MKSLCVTFNNPYNCRKWRLLCSFYRKEYQDERDKLPYVIYQVTYNFIEHAVFLPCSFQVSQKDLGSEAEFDNHVFTGALRKWGETLKITFFFFRKGLFIISMIIISLAAP